MAYRISDGRRGRLQTIQCFDIDHPNMPDPQFVLLATALCTSS